MPTEDAELGRMTVIDLSHESLMRVWRRLQGWVEEEAQSARIYRRLVDTATLWKEGKAGLVKEGFESPAPTIELKGAEKYKSIT